MQIKIEARRVGFILYYDIVLPLVNIFVEFGDVHAVNANVTTAFFPKFIVCNWGDQSNLVMLFTCRFPFCLISWTPTGPYLIFLSLLYSLFISFWFTLFVVYVYCRIVVLFFSIVKHNFFCLNKENDSHHRNCYQYT